MQQIKFRVWDKDSKEMYYPTTYLCIDWDKHFGSKLLCEIATENGSRACSDTEYEIMQFTGLKDKNGTDIYEGDIIQSKGGMTLYVKWIEKHAAFQYVNDHGFSAIFSGGDSVEVIGNNYQNKELLKG